jgi:predicted metal-dependent enzyme (double-stranded beta helix superfamily)
VRNNIYSNEFFDLHIITWNVGQGSRIHDHSENGCVLKILQGQLQETKFWRDTVDVIKVAKLE